MTFANGLSNFFILMRVASMSSSKRFHITETLALKIALNPDISAAESNVFLGFFDSAAPSRRGHHNFPDWRYFSCFVILRTRVALLWFWRLPKLPCIV